MPMTNGTARLVPYERSVKVITKNIRLEGPMVHQSRPRMAMPTNPARRPGRVPTQSRGV